jgi:hypothetical protein
MASRQRADRILELRGANTLDVSDSLTVNSRSHGHESPAHKNTTRLVAEHDLAYTAWDFTEVCDTHEAIIRTHHDLHTAKLRSYETARLKRTPGTCSIF